MACGVDVKLHTSFEVELFVYGRQVIAQGVLADVQFVGNHLAAPAFLCHDGGNDLPLFCRQLGNFRGFRVCLLARANANMT